MDGRPALDGYLQKIQENDVPSAYFDPVADIDEVSDLGHAISCMKSIREAAKYQPLFVPRRTLAWVELMGITVSTPPNENHDPRDYLDNPPDGGSRKQKGGPCSGNKGWKMVYADIYSAASITCLHSTAAVTEPTPPGTGEMARTFGSILSNWTSPQIPPPGAAFTPMSMTT